MRFVSNLPIPEVSTPVPSLMTIRLALVSIFRDQRIDGSAFCFLFTGSDFFQFSFLVSQVLIDLGDVVVVGFLHFFFVAFKIIFG